MNQLFSKVSNFIEKIGKQNFILILFIFFALVITGLYQTFSLYTESEGLSIVDGVKTYKFILDASNTTNSITVAAGSSKNIDVTVANKSEITLLYGIYYSSSSTLTDVNIGYLPNQNNISNGTIDANSNLVVTFKIKNNSDSNITFNFGLKYGLESGGDLTLESGQYWFEEYVEVEENDSNFISDYIQSLYNDGSALTTVNIGGDTANPTVSLNATQGIMLDNNGEYRYYGANPNNYVNFNGELWRIISVSNVKSSTSNTVGETRVKIVKADILTDDNGLNTYSYDSSDSTVNSGYGVNDWTQADLMTELNTLYYNSTSGTCYNGQSNASTACDFTNTGLSADARNLTEDAVYYLGGSSEYKGLYADDYYTFERGTNVYDCSTDDGACPRATSWTGKIGLIYPSDYAYATDLSLCTKDGWNYNTDGCYNNDWLLYSSDWQWIISLYSSSAYGTFSVASTGYVDSNGYMYRAEAVRPVQYLRSEVAIVGGEGTSTNPYQISLS